MPRNKLDKMREAGAQTCPTTRHAQMIVDDLRSRKGMAKLLQNAGYDPDHMADTIEDIVLLLWHAREA